MKLQLALDLVNIPEAIEVIKEVEEHIDFVEIGTPVINKEGFKALSDVKAAFPNLVVLADLKIMDAAGHELSQASAAGADIITILAQAEDSSIKGAAEEAKKQATQVVIDMIAVKDVKKRAAELDKLGADYICVHTGLVLQAEGKNSFEDLRTIKSVVKNTKTAIAGGIKLETLAEVIKAEPDLIIVGGGITSKEDKKAAAAKIQKLIKEADDIFIVGSGSGETQSLAAMTQKAKEIGAIVVAVTINPQSSIYNR